MELLFLYVSKYKLFKEQSFHFDSRYRFSYEKCGNFYRTLRLASCDESVLPKDFYHLAEFGPGTIDCVSAVIGENGAGKTSLAVLMQDIIEPGGDIKEFVAIFADRRGDGDVKFSVYCHVPRDINDMHNSISFVGFKNKPDIFYWPDYTWPQNAELDLRTRLRLIYYSPLFTTERVFGYRRRVYDEDEPRESMDGLRHLTDVRKYAIQDISVTGSTLDLLDDDTFSRGSQSLLIYERKRVIDFIKVIANDNELADALDIQKLRETNALVFALLDGDLNETLHPVTVDLPGMTLEPGKLEVEGLDVEEYFDVTGKAQYLRSPVIKAFYLYANACFREWQFSYKKDKSFRNDINWLIRIGNVARRRMVRNVSAKAIASYLIGKMQNYRGRDSRFLSFGEFMIKLQRFVSVATEDIPKTRWCVPLKGCQGQSYEEYIGLMEAYFEARRRMDVCAFGIKNRLSSGEMHYLSMWARLYKAFKGMRDGVAGHESAILFMDEAETALHPKWQRRLVLRVLTTWTRLMPADKHLQVIFASHSPMLLSDIPKGNVMFLGASDQIKAMEALSNTFGANIFDLFKSSFFLDEGPIGEFARRKINSLLGRLSEDGAVIKRDSDDEALARLVGDSFIHSYLKSCID